VCCMRVKAFALSGWGDNSSTWSSARDVSSQAYEAHEANTCLLYRLTWESMFTFRSMTYTSGLR
jgi:hypothetical protein